MLSASKTPILALVLACAALAAAVASAQAPPLQSVIFEGPGGRTPLTDWTLREDPANRGISLGWQRGAFAGSTVSVPNVASPTPYTGHAGGRNYEGSVAWYRTSFKAAQTGAPTIFLYDGHPGGIGIARTAYARFEELCEDARRLIAGCPCASGCPSCVQSPKCGNLNEPLHKAGALALLERLLAAEPALTAPAGC